ncbi:hypothetical protein PC116_g359 [Phytophthora cactorum]|uniref:Uncharacterized protein n=1 Tax=Phytophthora cactorum TaxID=29920 RepID=A0A8T1LVZ5_9STRA|nr:hypothetical protein Pcac1_g245 [Phytophthora cactorum]KAG2935046.1 hypothetical protein PC114_g834 [Phytophthora cactorum]KAG2955901.1 hypothetical protein PC117_g104 [Phytophthora cactorum]KAG3036277.1 hypothetical protein PC120_g364 [Phytophthora cactorum]KAG3042206.1 hypothetical protein PC119_g327 [Phytophthora cactorum]
MRLWLNRKYEPTGDVNHTDTSWCSLVTMLRSASTMASVTSLTSILTMLYVASALMLTIAKTLRS